MTVPTVSWGLEPGAFGIAYIGIASGKGGITRRYYEEWRPVDSGRSTPRRTLGALLLDDLGLRPKPRLTRTAPPNPRNYCFAEPGESALTDWIEAHGTFAYVEASSDELGTWGTLANLEQAVLQQARPPLNINGWDNPNRPRLRSARDAAAHLAKQWAVGDPIGE
jgi:hypothetical protein